METFSIIDKDLTTIVNEVGKGKMTTSFNNLQNLDNDESTPFNLKFDLLIDKGDWDVQGNYDNDDTEGKRKELDYVKATEGDLVYRVNVPRRRLVFDINAKGELVVIGLDADKFIIDKKTGDLLFMYEGEPNSDALFNYGLMKVNEKLRVTSALYSYPRAY